MDTLVTDLLKVLARNRQRYPKHWDKVFVERLPKLVTPDVDATAVVTALLADTRVKSVLKEDGAGDYKPAVQLRFVHYKTLRRSTP